MAPSLRRLGQSERCERQRTTVPSVTSAVPMDVVQMDAVSSSWKVEDDSVETRLGPNPTMAVPTKMDTTASSLTKEPRSLCGF